MCDVTEQITFHEDDIYMKQRVALIHKILKPKHEHSGVSNSESV